MPPSLSHAPMLVCEFDEDPLTYVEGTSVDGRRIRGIRGAVV